MILYIHYVLCLGLLTHRTVPRVCENIITSNFVKNIKKFIEIQIIKYIISIYSSFHIKLQKYTIIVFTRNDKVYFFRHGNFNFVL